MTTASQHKAFATTRLGVNESVYDKLQEDHKAHETRKCVKAVLGENFPEAATSFHTEGRTATFLLGETGAFVDVDMTEDQLADMRARGLTGTFGFDCYA